jgi:catechol 2,3-dioxygenase-like lactoylglutathione lyase family enzyme
METDDPSVRLELLQYVSPEGAALDVNSLPNTAGLRHLAFTLPDTAALTELASRLRATGVTLVSEPEKVPFRVGSLGHKHLFYFLDPDGVIIEAAAYER